MKKCTKCSKTFPATTEYFHKQTAMKDGLRPACKECSKKNSKKYYQENREKETARKKIYRKQNPEKIKNYERNRYRKDIRFRLIKLYRSHLYYHIKSEDKSDTTKQLIGCSIAELKQHLEKQFDDKMSWDNQGSYWHIDHIIPCASFDLTDPEQQKECFHYTNLQPLEAIENIKKGDKILF